VRNLGQQVFKPPKQMARFELWCLRGRWASDQLWRKQPT